MFVILIVSRLEYHLAVLYAEPLCHVHELRAYGVGVKLILHDELGIGALEVTRQQVEHTTEDVHERTEVVQFVHDGEKIVALQRAYLFRCRRMLYGVCGVFVHGTVTDDGAVRERSAEHQSFERAASAERHVCLTMREGTLHVDDGMVEGQSLALVHRNRPSQLHRILTERAVHLLRYLVGALVNDVACIVPLLHTHVDDGSAVACADREALVVTALHGSEHAVIESLVLRRVILDEHHLRTFLQRQRLLCWEEHVRELAFHLGIVRIFLAGEQSHLTVVLLLCLIVMCGQTYVSVFRLWLESAYVARVERLQHGVVRTIVSHLVEEFEEACVALTIHLLQFHYGIARLAKRKRGEEVWRIIIM